MRNSLLLWLIVFIACRPINIDRSYNALFVDSSSLNLLGLMRPRSSDTGTTDIGTSSTISDSGVNSNATQFNQNQNSTFDLDFSDRKVTKFRGEKMRFDIGLIELIGFGGILQLMNFNKQSSSTDGEEEYMRFMNGDKQYSLLFEGNHVRFISRDNQLLWALELLDSVVQSSVTFAGSSHFYDVWLDKKQSRSIASNLCLSDSYLSNTTAKCSLESHTEPLSMLSTLQSMGHLLFRLSEHQREHHHRLADEVIRVADEVNTWRAEDRLLLDLHSNTSTLAWSSVNNTLASTASDIATIRKELKALLSSERSISSHIMVRVDEAEATLSVLSSNVAADHSLIAHLEHEIHTELRDNITSWTAEIESRHMSLETAVYTRIESAVVNTSVVIQGAIDAALQGYLHTSVEARLEVYAAQVVAQINASLHSLHDSMSSSDQQLAQRLDAAALNSSLAIARSNSAVVRMISDVNSTVFEALTSTAARGMETAHNLTLQLSALNDTLNEQLSASGSALQDSMTIAVDDLSQRLVMLREEAHHNASTAAARSDESLFGISMDLNSSLSNLSLVTSQLINEVNGQIDVRLSIMESSLQSNLSATQSFVVDSLDREIRRSDELNSSLCTLSGTLSAVQSTFDRFEELQEKELKDSEIRLNRVDESVTALTMLVDNINGSMVSSMDQLLSRLVVMDGSIDTHQSELLALQTTQQTMVLDSAQTSTELAALDKALRTEGASMQSAVMLLNTSLIESRASIDQVNSSVADYLKLIVDLQTRTDQNRADAETEQGKLSTALQQHTQQHLEDIVDIHLTLDQHTLHAKKMDSQYDALKATATIIRDTLDKQHTDTEAELKELRQMVLAQNHRLIAAEVLVEQQQREITQLQEAQRRATTELTQLPTNQAMDQLRQVLFDLQGSMLTHSSKVLDILLQKHICADRCLTTAAGTE